MGRTAVFLGGLALLGTLVFLGDFWSLEHSLGRRTTTKTTSRDDKKAIVIGTLPSSGAPRGNTTTTTTIPTTTTSNPVPWSFSPSMAPSQAATENVSVEDATTEVVVAASAENASDMDHAAPICCYHSGINLTATFTKAFFEHQRTLDQNAAKWTGTECEDWKTISEGLHPPGGNNADDEDADAECQAEWTRLLLEESRGFYLRVYMDYLMGKGEDFWGDTFRYVGDREGQPRVLFLGDSISRGIWVELYPGRREESVAALHKSPANCKGFPEYESNLDKWLGDCPWDAIQFNVGMHFHGGGGGKPSKAVRSEYEQKLARVVRRLREHSPRAALLFGLTTPSPLDSPETTLDPSDCPNYHKFHPKGFVPFLNRVASRFLPRLNVTINDRYSAIYPTLRQHQRPCDIHYTPEGYGILADRDWEAMAGVLPGLVAA